MDDGVCKNELKMKMKVKGWEEEWEEARQEDSKTGRYGGRKGGSEVEEMKKGKRVGNEKVRENSHFYFPCS